MSVIDRKVGLKFDFTMEIHKWRKCCTCGKIEPKQLCCGRCRSTSYCSLECQKSDWPRHKKHCGVKITASEIRDQFTKLWTQLQPQLIQTAVFKSLKPCDGVLIKIDDFQRFMQEHKICFEIHPRTTIENRVEESGLDAFTEVHGYRDDALLHILVDINNGVDSCVSVLILIPF